MIESPYPKTEPRRPYSWTVEVVAAILLTAIAAPGLEVLLAPKLAGIVTALGNDRSFGVSVFLGVDATAWLISGIGFVGAIGLTLYFRTRGQLGKSCVKPQHFHIFMTSVALGASSRLLKARSSPRTPKDAISFASVPQ